MISPKIELTDKVAIVTGARGEIGRVIALDLIRAGASVAAVIRRGGQELRKLFSQVAGGAESSLVVQADVRSESDVKRMVDRVLRRFGQLDILVNNAAVRGPTGPVTRLGLKEWQEVLGTNLTGPFLCSRECLVHMVERQQGRIINISSMAGRTAYPLRASYSASKWGLIGLTLTLAAEVGSSNIQVNAVCPGPVEGTVMDDVIANRARALGIPVPAMRKQFVSRTALGRMVTATDVSRMVLFLCSEAARNVTGQAIEVSAGFGLGV